MREPRTTTPAIISGADGSVAVSGSHTYATVDSGGYLLTITISDDSPGVATATGHSAAMGEILVLAAQPLPLTESKVFSGAVATFSDNFTDRTGADFTATIDWGDGTISPGGIRGGNGNFTVTGIHTYIDEGSFNTSIQLKVNAAGGPPLNAGNIATVAEADVITAGGTNVSATRGQPFAGTVATFTDPNAQNFAGDFTATIDWGDGTAATTGIVTGANGSFSVSGTHTFNSAGQPQLTITIGDDAPGTAGVVLHTTASVSPAMPTVLDARFLYDQSPPGVSFTFDEGVTIDPSALTVRNLATGAVEPVAFLQYLVGPHTATFRFAAALPNGNYRATLSAAAVSDAASKHLAADATLDFFSLQGDVNRDRTVGFADLLIIAQNYGASSATYAQGDLDGDGLVGFSDLLILAQNYGESVPPPTAAGVVNHAPSHLR